MAGNSPLLTPPPPESASEQRTRRNSACSGHRPLYRVPGGGVAESSPAATTGEAVSASCELSEEAKGAVGRKLSKVGLRKLKIW